MFEIVTVLGRHPEKFGNHDCRQRKSEIRDEIRRLRSGEMVEEFIDDRHHVWSQCCEATRSEGATQRFAQPSVIGRIVEHHPSAQQIDRGRQSRTIVVAQTCLHRREAVAR